MYNKDVGGWDDLYNVYLNKKGDDK